MVRRGVPVPDSLCILACVPVLVQFLCRFPKSTGEPAGTPKSLSRYWRVRTPENFFRSGLPVQKSFSILASVPVPPAPVLGRSKGTGEPTDTPVGLPNACFRCGCGAACVAAVMPLVLIGASSGSGWLPLVSSSSLSDGLLLGGSLGAALVESGGLPLGRAEGSSLGGADGSLLGT